MHMDLDSYLHLVRADMELAEDVAKEVLDLVPWVDTVGAIQHDHNVHVRGASCHMKDLRNTWLAKAGQYSMFVCLSACLRVQMCGYFAMLERWSLLARSHR